MFNAKTARKPRWGVNRDAVNLLVIFEENGVVHDEVPFSASPNDSMAYGRELFHRAREGEFGHIDEPSEEEIKHSHLLRQRAGLAMTTARISQLQQAIDIAADAATLGKRKKATNTDVLQTQLHAWRVYRVELAQLEDQPGYPTQVQWPTPPDAAAL